jgi:hypothetical protein
MPLSEQELRASPKHRGIVEKENPRQTGSTMDFMEMEFVVVKHAKI